MTTGSTPKPEGQETPKVLTEEQAKEKALAEQLAAAFMADLEAKNAPVKGQEVQKVTDKSNVVAVAEKVSADSAKEMTKAEVATELLQILESGKKDNEVIVMVDETGQKVQLTVGERRQQLRAFLKETGVEVKETREDLQAFIKKTGEHAVAMADILRQKPEGQAKSPADLLGEKLAENQKKRDDAAAALGIQPRVVKIPDLKGNLVEHKIYDVKAEDIQKRMASAKPGTPEAENLKKFDDAMKEYDQLRMIEASPSFIRLRFAELKMAGATDRDARINAGPNEVKASKREIMDAYQLVNEAGRISQAMSDSPSYQDVKRRASLLYADTQQQRSKDAVLALQAADKLRSEGKPEAEVRKAYDQALAKVREVDMNAIRAQIITQNKEMERIQKAKAELDKVEPAQREAARKALEEQEKQQTEIIQQLGQILHVGKEVKTEYAKYLNERGKGSEAFVLLTEAAAEAPEFCSKEADPSFAAEMEKAIAGKGLISSDTEKHRSAYQEAMNNKQWGKASQELQALKNASTNATQATLKSVNENVAAAEASLREVDAKMAQVKADEQMDAETKAAELDTLTRQKTMLEQTAKGLKDSIPKIEAEAKKQEHQLQFMEGIVAWSSDNKETAHRIFKELEVTAPEIRDNKDYQLADLIEDSRHKGWLERNWDKIKTVVTIGGAILAGVVVGIAVGCVTGPGGILAGIGTTGAILTAAGVGAVAGGLTYAGLNRGAHEIAQANEWKSTASYHEKPDFVSDFKTGAIIGGSTATGQVLLAPGGILATSGIATTRLGSAAITTARFATGPGAPLVGYGGAGVHQGYEMAVNGKSFKDAAVDFGIEGTGYTAALYSTGKYGLGTWKGASLTGFSLSGQEQGRAVYHGKNLGQAAYDFGVDGFTYTLTGKLIGNYSQGVKGYNMLKAKDVGFGTAFTNNAAQTARWTGNEIVMMGDKSTGGRVLATSVGVGLPSWMVYSESSAYNETRTPKDLDDPNYQKKIGDNIDTMKKKIDRPKTPRYTPVI